MMPDKFPAITKMANSNHATLNIPDKPALYADNCGTP